MSYLQCQQFCARYERFSSRDTTASYEESNELWSCGLLLLFFNHTFFTTSLSTSVSPQVIGLKSSQHSLVFPSMQSAWHCLFWRLVCQCREIITSNTGRIQFRVLTTLPPQFKGFYDRNWKSKMKKQWRYYSINLWNYLKVLRDNRNCQSRYWLQVSFSLIS